ncbi:VanW family protein [Desulfothermobacter acidiphilus]|uniref:VanW family protein n=1 Tax=Desulfothermobacter acidiphilus TaxID=1938353 RepID=UPI003F89A1F1
MHKFLSLSLLLVALSLTIANDRLAYSKSSIYPGADLVLFIGLPRYGVLDPVNGLSLCGYVDADVATFVYNDRVYVPVRTILQTLVLPLKHASLCDAKAVFVFSSTLTPQDTELVFFLGNPLTLVNGSERESPAPPLLVKGRVCVPVRTMAEVLARELLWDPPEGDRPGIVILLATAQKSSGGQVSRSGRELSYRTIEHIREAAEKLVILAELKIDFPGDEKFWNNIHNARLAAERIDGTILYPGQVFSFNAATGPRTIENGFKWGWGLVGPDLGAGVCRTATILYQAAREAGLEIVERHTHVGGDVPYASHEDDAAIQWGKADLKFRNNYGFPVKIRVWHEEESSLRAKITRLVN